MGVALGLAWQFRSPVAAPLGRRVETVGAWQGMRRNSDC